MAKARVYVRWSGQDAWSGPLGTGSSQQADRNTAADHAERQAWKEAWNKENGAKIKTFFDAGKDADHNKGAKLDVKIWVDQQVCGECQLWMIAVVLRNLPQLGAPARLFAEVKSGGHTDIMEVTRDAVWPVNMGLIATLDEIRQRVTLVT